jgi:hypothetical protein
MNATDYSLSSDSRRWWWPSALAGAAGVAAITAVLVLPGAGQAVPEPQSPAEPAPPVFLDQSFDRQCFLWRANWNEGLDGFQPRCPGSVPEQLPRPGPGSPVFLDQSFDRQCVLWRASWNEGLDGFQPRCPGPPRIIHTWVVRPGLDYLP